MNNEFKGRVTVRMLDAPVRVNYRVLWGMVPHIMDAHIVSNDMGGIVLVAAMPDSVRVRIYDAIIADVREREIERMAERDPLGAS